jgi:hypothetical protein
MMEVDMRRYVTIGLIVVASPALADPSPLSGYYAYTALADHQSDEMDDLICAFAFFRQGTDGKGEAFVIDLETYQTTGNIAFVHTADFTCDYDANAKTEACMTTLLDDDSPPFPFYSRYYSISNDAAVLDNFPDKAALDKSFKTPQLAPMADATRGSYRKCVWLSDAIVKPYIKEWDSSVTREEIDAANAYPFGPSNSAQMQDVAQKVKAALQK